MTLLGKTYVSGSREFMLLSKYANNRSLLIVLLIFLVAAINLGYSINIVLASTNTSDALLKIGLATLLLIIIFVVTYASMREQYRTMNVKDAHISRKDDEK